MFFILEIILNVIMTMLSLICIALGIAIWWTANILIIKLVASVLAVLVGLAIMGTAVMAWCNV